MRSKVPTDKYREEYDRIFKKQQKRYEDQKQDSYKEPRRDFEYPPIEDKEPFKPGEGH